LARTSWQSLFLSVLAIVALGDMAACSSVIGDFQVQEGDASVDDGSSDAGSDGTADQTASPPADAASMTDVAREGATPADAAPDAIPPGDAPADVIPPGDAPADAPHLLADAGPEASQTDPGLDACVSESDTALCSALGKNCGPVTAPDSCGTMRTVASCGTCATPQTCGASAPNQCGCVAESDATFCTRLGHTCGALAGADNCGKARTVANCGTCLPTNSCSAAGICVCGAFAGCTAGQTCCSNGCFSVGSDPSNCAGCGISCGPGDAWECYAGQCGCGIRGNGNACGAACNNFNTNSNCAHCGDACDVIGGDLCCTLQGGTVYACRYGGDCAR